MTLNFLGGLNNAFQSYQQGVQTNIDRANLVEDRTTNRANALEDREFQRGQRALQVSQQQRVVDQQGRDETLRKANAATPLAGTMVDGVTPVASGGADSNTDPTSIDAQNGSDVGVSSGMTPAPKVVTQDQELRGIAANFHAAGDVGKALELNAKADQIGMARSARLFQQVRAASTNKSALDIAREVTDVYNNDPLPGQVTSVVDLGGGAARVSFRNRDTGATNSRDFKSGDEILGVLESYYSPDTLAARQKTLFDAHVKAEEQRATGRAKGVVVGAGQTFLPGEGDARGSLHVPKEFRPLATDAPADPFEAAKASAISSANLAMTKAETKISDPGTMSAVTSMVPLMMQNWRARNGGEILPPEVAARMAILAVQHPELVKPDLDMKTGTFANVITDDTTGKRLVVSGNMKLDDKTGLPVGVSADDAKAKVKEWLGQQGAGAQSYVAAAFDKTGAAKASMIEQARAEAQRQMGAFKAYTDAPAAQQKAMLTQAFDAADRLVATRVGLVAKFGEASAAGAAPRAFPAIAAPGGIAPPPSNGTNDLESNKRWVKNKLMGAFDGPGKLLEISRTSTNPKFREAAKALYDEATDRSGSYAEPTGAAL